ncbi:PHP domain-containing protein [bacterium]|nr:PHP domain-containing protein [bacterium]
MESNILKNKIFQYVIILFAFLLAGFGYYVIDVRYNISEPMQDLEYKTAIIKESHNPFYRLESLRPIVGEEELTEFIISNNNNPQIYTPSPENIAKGVFRANLHMHTLQSDGCASVKERLDAAQEYAQNNIKDGFMYIAITDHNTVLGAKEVVKLLEKYPNKYKNVKVILGMEVFTAFKSKYYDKPVEIHVLNWCINPYDKFLNKEFYKPKNANKGNRVLPDRDFDYVIEMMSKYAIPGIAHPIRYTNRIGQNKHLYMEEMIDRYTNLTNKHAFMEGFYQVYPRYYEAKFFNEEILPYIDYVNKKADEHNIIKTGSTDSHSMTIFD